MIVLSAKLSIALAFLLVKIVTAIPTAIVLYFPMQLPSIIHNPITKMIESILSMLFLLLSGVYSREDRSIDALLAKQPDTKVFLSNHCSILDTFFYLLKY